MKRKKYIIYCITCLPNDKKYTGKHTQNDTHPGYLGSGTLQRKAIKKYGKAAFVKQVLYESDNGDVLNEMEEYYIDYYNAIKSDLFYNLVEGGIGFTHSEKLSESKKKNNPMKGRFDDKHHFSKKVIQYDMAGNFIKIWDSLAQIYRALKIHQTSILSCINGKTVQAGKFIWLYYTDNYPITIPARTSTRGKGSGQTQTKSVKNLTTGKSYNSIVEAVKDGFNDTNVSLCCKGKLKTTGGCRWEYINA
jgi:NUMOD1 domain